MTQFQPPSGRPEWARPEYVFDAAGRASIPTGQPLEIIFVVGKSDLATVTVRNIVAFPAGFEFDVIAEYVAREDLWDPMQGLAGLRERPEAQEGALADEHLRLTLRFSDGSEANNLAAPTTKPVKPGPWLQYRSGKPNHGRQPGARASVEATFWVWPIPPAGQLAFVCEWPAQAIPSTKHEIDAGLIRKAARRATDAWPTEGGA